jgi:hypothetical protein
MDGTFAFLLFRWIDFGLRVRLKDLTFNDSGFADAIE